VIVDPGRRGVGLVPVRGGRVQDGSIVETAPDEIEGAVSRLAWPEAGAGEDWPWLTAWLRSPRARASFVLVSDGAAPETLRAALRSALAKPFARSAAGGNVGATREEA
jgi:hypothetical protein